MNPTDRLFMRLDIMKMSDFKTRIQMKSKRHKPFIAQVKEFLYDEDDTKVVLKRCKETSFPGEDNDSAKAEEFMVYIKDIKSVDRFRDEEE